jgi:hypothetical protein
VEIQWVGIAIVAPSSVLSIVPWSYHHEEYPVTLLCVPAPLSSMSWSYDDFYDVFLVQHDSDTASVLVVPCSVLRIDVVPDAVYVVSSQSPRGTTEYPYCQLQHRCLSMPQLCLCGCNHHHYYHSSSSCPMFDWSDGE